MKKCCLCNGKVVNGICTQCGMHNGRSDESYHMNERVEEKQPIDHSRDDAKKEQKKGQLPKQKRIVHR